MIVSILAFVRHITSVGAIQLCCYDMKVAIENTQDEGICIPETFLY